MSTAPKVLAFAGSTRKESFNRKLIKHAAAAAEKAGAQVTLIELSDYPMPLVDQDLEAAQGLPESAQKLKKLMIESSGLLIGSPEYNSSVTPLLKNTLDWISRPVKGEPSLVAFQGKIVAMLSASPSPFGGVRSQNHLRAVLSHVGSVVLPETVTIPNAHDAFNADGTFKDPKQLERVEKCVGAFVAFLRKTGA